MLEKLQEIVRRYTDDEDFILTENMILRSDLGINSYELVQMICDVEEAFDIEIPDRAIGGLKTVKDVLNYVGI
ncbi:MAG: phosphopantetheine-binding protein [Lachnospiraceae bacterium]|nr:phosphopantetheine-binding protein [Lachnospiraceae bacterium]